MNLTDPEPVNGISLESINCAERSMVDTKDTSFYPDISDATEYVCAPILGALSYCSGHKAGSIHSTIILLLPMRDADAISSLGRNTVKHNMSHTLCQVSIRLYSTCSKNDFVTFTHKETLCGFRF